MSQTNFPLKNHFDLSPRLLPWIILTFLWMIFFETSRTHSARTVQGFRDITTLFDSFLKTLSANKTIFMEKFIITLWNIQIWFEIWSRMWFRNCSIRFMHLNDLRLTFDQFWCPMRFQMAICPIFVRDLFEYSFLDNLIGCIYRFTTCGARYVV